MTDVIKAAASAITATMFFFTKARKRADFFPSDTMFSMISAFHILYTDFEDLLAEATHPHRRRFVAIKGRSVVQPSNRQKQERQPKRGSQSSHGLNNRKTEKPSTSRLLPVCSLFDNTVGSTPPETDFQPFIHEFQAFTVSLYIIFFALSMFFDNYVGAK